MVDFGLAGARLPGLELPPSEVVVGSLAYAPPEGLTDADLFALTAVRTQAVLDEAELYRVMNEAPSRVRSTVRKLLGMGLMESRDGRVRIPIGRLPAITRQLRRRHFLHWTD